MLPIGIRAASWNGAERLAAQLFASIKQLAIGGPNLQKISAVEVVFLSLPLSRADLELSIPIGGKGPFNGLYVSMEAQIQLFLQILKKEDRDSTGIEEQRRPKQRCIEDGQACAKIRLQDTHELSSLSVK